MVQQQPADTKFTMHTFQERLCAWMQAKCVRGALTASDITRQLKYLGFPPTTVRFGDSTARGVNFKSRDSVAQALK